MNNDDRGKDDDRIGYGTEWRVELSEKEKKILEEMQEDQPPKLHGYTRKLKSNGEKVDRVLQHVLSTLRHWNR